MRPKWQPGYDLRSAVTFFLAGLGAGSLLALVFSPRTRFGAALPTGAADDNREHPPAL